MAEPLRPIDPNNRISSQLAKDLNVYIDRRNEQRKRSTRERVGRLGFSMAGASEFMPYVTSELPLSRETAAEMAVAGADIKRRVAEMKAAIQTEGMVADRRKMTNMAQMMDSLADVTIAMIEVKGGYNTEVLKQRSATSREAAAAATEKLENEGWKYNTKLQAAGLTSNSRSQLDSRYGGLIPMDPNTGMKALPDPSSSEGKMLGQSLIADIQQRDPQILAHWMDRMDRKYGMSADDMQAYIGVSGGAGVARKVQTQVIDALRVKDQMKKIDREWEGQREAFWDNSLRAARMAGVDNPMLQQAEILRDSMKIIDPDAGTDLGETKLGKYFSGGEMDPEFADPALEAADALMEAFQDPYAPDSIKKLKAGIMQSQDFRTYMDSNQFTDPEQAFKYLIQDNRKKMREQKQETIRQRKINMGKIVPEEANLRGAVAAEKGVPQDGPPVEGGPVTEGSKKGLGSALLTAGSKVFGGKRAAARAKALGLDPGALSEMGESSKGLEDMSRQELRDLPTDLTPEEAELEGLDTTLSPEQEEEQAQEIIESHSKVGAGTNPLEEGGTFQANDGNQYRWDAKGFFVNTSGEGEQIPINSEQGMNLFKEFKAAVDKGEAESSAQTYLTDVDTPFDEIDEAVSAERDKGMGRPGTTQTEKKGSTFLDLGTRLGSGDVDKLSQWEVWKELDKRGLLSEKEKAQLDVTRGEVSGDTQGDRLKKNITMRRMLKDNMLDEASFGRARDRLFNHLKTEVGAGEEKTIGGTRRFKPIYEKDASGKKILKGYEEEQIGRKETRTGGYIPLSLEQRQDLVMDYANSVADKTGIMLLSTEDGTGFAFDPAKVPPQDRGEAAVVILENKLKAKGYEIVRGKSAGPNQVSGDDLDKLKAMSKDEGLTWEHVNRMGIRGDPTGERGAPSEEDIQTGVRGGMLQDDPFLPEAGEKYGGGLTRSFQEEEEDETFDDLNINVSSIPRPSEDIKRRLAMAKQKHVLKSAQLEGKEPPSDSERMDAALQAREAKEAEKRHKKNQTSVWD